MVNSTEAGVFDLEMNHFISDEEINFFSSSFIWDVLNEETKDLFEIRSIEGSGRELSFSAVITQRKKHPYSEGGFHLSAITASEIIQFAIGSNHNDILNDFRLSSHQITCVKTIRSKQPKFRIKVESKSASRIVINFEVEKKSYFGLMVFSRKICQHPKIKIKCEKRNFVKPHIKKAKIVHKKLLAELIFDWQNSARDNFGLRPDLLLALLAQLAIIQLYTMSTATSKQSGVVLISSLIHLGTKRNYDDQLNFVLETGKFRKSKKHDNHVVAEISFSGAKHEFSGSAVYFFEPMDA